MSRDKAEAYEILAGDRVCAVFADGELTITDKQFAPLFLDDFKEWVSRRAISDQRGAVARNLKSTSDIPVNADAYETSLKAHCISITDNYWVREAGSELAYADIDCDAYDGRLAQLALGIESDPSGFMHKGINPELTNIGNSNKAWVIDDEGKRWLHKRQPLRECYNEIIASRIALKLGIATVEYELVETQADDPLSGFWGIVRSKDFTQGKNINLEHADLILKHFGTDEKDISKNAAAFDSFGRCKEYLDIKYLDILTGNSDRHSRNYGILRSRTDGRVVGFAPNYDNNYAFRTDLKMASFAKAAAERGYVPPVLTEADAGDIIAEAAAFDGYDIVHILDSVKWKQRSLINEIEKARLSFHNIPEHEELEI